MSITPDPEGYEPSEAEIDAWAAHEHERREAWLHGPTAAQKADWAARERARRMGRLGGPVQFKLPLPIPDADTRRLAQHYIREAQLAFEGGMNLLMNTSVRDMFDQLVRAGRDWEDEFTSQPPRRRRIPLGDEGSTGAPSQPS